MNQWIEVKHQPPPISYLESDNKEDVCEAYPVVVFSPERPIILCLATLQKYQNEDHFHHGELFWEVYVPISTELNSECVDVIEKSFDMFTHWIPIPEIPVKL